MDPVYPEKYPYFYTVADAFDGVKNDPEEVKKRLDIMAPTNMGRILRRIPKNPKKVIKGSAIMNGSWFNLSRLSFDCPADTITAMGTALSTAGQCHPIEDRKLTIAELKRIDSLPDDFILTGDLNQQGERIGRMVPPIMMMNISKTIQKEVLDKCRS
jgi:DNA (cytosine-5)-methyltransferase 1